MKKAALILFVSAFFAILPAAGTGIAHGQSAAGLTFVNDLSIGSYNPEVAMLQTLLISKGFSIPAIQSGIISKGYFGAQTKLAVMRYQSSLSIAPTGFVGPLTRAKLNGMILGGGDGQGQYVGPLSIISPNGGETLRSGTMQNIRWTSPQYIRATYANISLVPYYPPCDRNYTCPMYAYHAPYKIANGVSINQNAYSWVVGSHDADSNYYGGSASSVPDGQYTIQICEADSSVCDSSDRPFTINAGYSGGNDPSYAPIISSIQAPGRLQVGETGTWTVRASDPRSSTLNYSVTWGDERYYAAGVSSASNPLSQNFVQSATFTHAYSNPGTYTVTFIVTNSAGLTTRSTATVTVTGSATGAAASITMVSPNGGENWQSGSNRLIRWDFSPSTYYDSNTSYQTYFADIIITQYQAPCAAGIACSRVAPITYKIAAGIPASQEQYSWNVGSASYNQMNLPSGNYIMGVCFANTSNCAVSDNPFVISGYNDGGSQSSLVYTLNTDKFIYSQNEQVRIRLQAYNPTNYPITLSFNSGCETKYRINNFDSTFGMACTANMPIVTIAPKSTKVWEMVNEPSRYRIPIGMNTIIGSLNGSNSVSASAIIEVR